MSDSPEKPVDQGFIFWMAQTTLVGRYGNGSWNQIHTLTWGFITGNNSIVVFSPFEHPVRNAHQSNLDGL